MPLISHVTHLSLRRISFLKIFLVNNNVYKYGRRKPETRVCICMSLTRLKDIVEALEGLLGIYG